MRLLTGIRDGGYSSETRPLGPVATSPGSRVEVVVANLWQQPCGVDPSFVAYVDNVCAIHHKS